MIPVHPFTVVPRIPDRLQPLFPGLGHTGKRGGPVEDGEVSAPESINGLLLVPHEEKCPPCERVSSIRTERTSHCMGLVSWNSSTR
jgi:hypothetical protein